MTVYSLHPGVIRTEFTRHLKEKLGLFWYLLILLSWPFMKNPVRGAQTTIYCVVDENIAGHSGRYYGDCKEKSTSKLVQDDQLASKLSELSAEFVDM